MYDGTKACTLRDYWNHAASVIDCAGVSDSRSEAAYLICAVMKWDYGGFFARLDDCLDEGDIANIDDWLNRRAKREPLCRMKGWKYFWKHRFYMCSETLSPRPDSEVIIEEALQIFDRDSEIRILDLGTGSGCLLLSLLHEFPNAKGIGVDISENTIDIARKNAKNILDDDRAAWLCADWRDREFNRRILDAYDDRFDCIISNPPYIPSKNLQALEPEVLFDPVISLDGGGDGCDAYRDIIPKVRELMSQDGVFLLELGDVDVVGEILHAGCFSYRVAYDLGSIPRCIIAR